MADDLKLHELLQCVGYWGFGTGYQLGRNLLQVGSTTYCNMCPHRIICWTQHKARCAEIIPAVAEEFEKMACTIIGPTLVKQWIQQYNVMDPYSVVAAGNIQDGILISQGQPPEDRGEGTLPRKLWVRFIKEH